MKGKIIQILIIFAVGVAAFLALYLQQPRPEKAPIQPAVKESAKEIVPIPTPISIPALAPISIPTPEPKPSPLFTVKVDADKPIKIGIFGESREDDESEPGFNTVIVSKILKALKKNQAQAIFFMGNLVSGVEKSEKDKQSKIDVQQLEQKLKEFSSLYSGVFGADVPFFPVLGDREIAIADSAETFMEQFHLNGAVIIEKELVYGVSIGPAFFAVIASEIFSPQALARLQQTLSDAAKTHKNLFVIGYEPAFPSASTYLKESASKNGAFWKILVDNHVMAYFSSKEHLFDRSERYGVWQIISGGGGAPLSQGGGSQPFFHGLILTLPVEKEKKPTIQVIDVDGDAIGEYELNDQQGPLHQMRIS